MLDDQIQACTKAAISLINSRHPGQCAAFWSQPVRLHDGTVLIMVKHQVTTDHPRSSERETNLVYFHPSGEVEIYSYTLTDFTVIPPKSSQSNMVLSDKKLRDMTDILI